MMINLIMAIFLVLLQFADFYTTYQIISLKKGREAWPPTKCIIQKIGLLYGLALVKSVAVIGTGLLYYTESRSIIIGLLLIYIAVVINNYKIYKSE